MVLIDWLMIALLHELKLETSELISVGNDFNCHYQPSQLSEAMKNHQELYLTNQFIVPQLKIEVPILHLIGGFDDCNDIHQGKKSHGRTQISGMGETNALSVYGFGDTHNNSIIIENFEMTLGRSSQGAGMYVDGPVRLKLINSLIHNNHGVESGGGIFVAGNASLIELKGSQIYNNYATEGGGLAINGKYNLISLNDSMIYGNHALKLAGGIYCINQNSVEIKSSEETAFTQFNHAHVYDNQAELGKNYFFALSCQFKLLSSQFNGLSGIN
jgi:hypothetical protein